MKKSKLHILLACRDKNIILTFFHEYNFGIDITPYIIYSISFTTYYKHFAVIKINERKLLMTA